MTACVSAVTADICLNNCSVSSREEIAECFLKSVDWWIQDQLTTGTEGELREEEAALLKCHALKRQNSSFY